VADARPNILIFMTDQEQAAVVHPDHPCQTPNATRLARDGIIFSNAYCPTAHCCPSRATFFSGLYPSQHGIFNNVSNPTAIHRGLNPGVCLFSEDLRESGYNLAFSGKWHVTDLEDPADRGWEQLHLTAGKGSYMHRSLEQWRAQAREPRETRPRRRGEIVRPGWGNLQLYDSYPSAGPRGYEEHRDYPVVQAALDALPRLAGDAKPWCLYVGPIGPHDPYVVPDRFLKQYDPATIPLPPSFSDTLEDKPRVYQRMRRQYWGQLSEDEVRESIAHYWAFCSMEDALFGEVLDALAATGQAENTLVLRMSDHGDYCGAHGLYLKGVPAFREAYNVACIARWPEGIRNPGREVDSFVTLADFAPTFLDLAGCPVPEQTVGRSIQPFFVEETPDDWSDSFCSQLNGVELYYSQRIAQTREYKYVYNGFDFDELYALVDDPHEMRNLADDPAYAEVKRNLVRRMWRFAGQTDDIIFNPYGTVALAPWGPAEAF